MIYTLNTILADVAAGSAVRGETNVDLVLGILLFVIAGFLMAFAALFAGRFVRPALPHPEKTAVYECGEPTIGDSWVQFDLRFYVVALVFIVFDVEIALFWPWAVAFGSADAATQAGAGLKAVAFYDMLFFFGVVVVGFLYLWKYGYLDWVRAASSQKAAAVVESEPLGQEGPALGLPAVARL
jgi:NADH-quinone oxidoreductase subunit A